MNKTIYLSFTISKDDDENCSLSYRRIKFSVEEIEKIIDTISDIEPTQVKSLKYAFGVIFKEFYKQPLQIVKPKKILQIGYSNKIYKNYFCQPAIKP